MSAPRRPMPPPLPDRPRGLWRDTPPVIFPPVLGLLGLGLGWREAARVLGAPGEIGELILGGAAMLLVFCLAAWLAKPLRRPAVTIEELRTLPGRAGLGAMLAAVLLLAAALVPLAPRLATGIMVAGIAAYLGLIAVLVPMLVTGPEEGRSVTPAFHLIFVGLILAPLSAIELGHAAASGALFWVMVVLAMAIWVASARQLLQRIPPAPLRPLLAIHLAPASLFAIVGTRLGLDWIALAFAVLASALAIALVASARWIAAAGFTPMWGAFTFPTAAFATALLSVSGGAGVAGAAGGLVLVVATLSVPVITFRVLRSWARGELAARTNAARA